MSGVFDTSVFVAIEHGRPINETLIPEGGCVSVVTLAELEAGVLAAETDEERTRREGSLRFARETFTALPVDKTVASSFAELRVALNRAGRRLNVQDTWIAATARVHGLPVYTQDADFDHLDVAVVHV